MDKDKLVELAERCEAATEPSIGLDDDIAKALSGSDGNYCSRSYTASLDAAVMLVPNGGCIEIGNWEGDWGRVFVGDKAFFAEAKTLPLALCAAALRSHAQPK